MVWGLELEKEMARASQRARAWGCAAGLPRVDIRAIQCTSCMSIVRDYKDEYWGTLGRVMGMGWQLVWAMVKDQARVRVSRWKKVRASRRLQHHGLPQQCECIPFELQLKITFMVHTSGRMVCCTCEQRQAQGPSQSRLWPAPPVRHHPIRALLPASSVTCSKHCEVDAATAHA